MNRLLLLALLVPACSRASGPDLASNFTTVKVDKQITKDGTPYTGTLVAREREIVDVARIVLDEVAFDRVQDAEPSGLVLRVPIKDGVLQGKAIVYADLRAPKLAREVQALAGSELLAIAREVTPAIPVAEATFVNGKLDGQVIAYAPSKDGRGTTKVAELTLKDNKPHGEAREYYRGTTQVHRVARFEAGIEVGVQERFHENGTLESKVTYLAGEPHGESIEHYANGAKREIATYENGQLVGTLQEWFPNGQLRREIVVEGENRRSKVWYSNGKLESEYSDGETRYPPDGVIEEFHRSGMVASRATFTAGVQNGKYETFYSDGKKHEVGDYANGRKVGTHQSWWKNGQLALDSRYIDGALDGKYERFYASGKAWEKATYKNGKLDGEYRKWWKNGKPAHVYAYKNGKLDGEYKTFYDTGAKWGTGTYVEGKGQGTVERWFPDGKLGYTMSHEKGRPHGPFKRWWADGKPRLEATYVDGHLHGDYKNWLEDGTLLEHQVLERGMVAKTIVAKPGPS
jgi:antitoxin component YwqK of YwqJK toxin-antitoxin module